MLQVIPLSDIFPHEYPDVALKIYLKLERGFRFKFGQNIRFATD